MLKDIVTIRGCSGRFRVVKPMRSGIVAASLNELKIRTVKNFDTHKISSLEDIHVYTIGKEQSVPLAKGFEKLHVAFAGKLDADLDSSGIIRW